MNIRMKFKKHGCMKFIGHLDIMRYFQKAIRRADIDIAYSEGFSPHMIMSFAAPLGVGLTSEGEYVDLQVNSCVSSKAAVDALNSVMVDGMEVVSFKMLPENVKNAMSSVAAADYFVNWREGYAPEGWEEKFLTFLQKEEIHSVHLAVNRLPEKQKLVVLLFYMENLSTTQISEVLGIPQGTVLSRLHQARKRLQHELEGLLHE